MNTKFNKAPRFKTVEEKKFQERSSFKSQDRKLRQESERKPERRGFREDRAFEKPQNIYPTEGRKASGEGSVQIWVKGGGSAKEKKTGPLSPRAPEKIKKNRLEEMKVYGENACITLFQQRPEAIVRLWATVEGAKKLGDVMSYLAENKKAYHVIDREEMERVTGTEHHGDMCLLVKKSPSFVLEGYLQVPKKQDCLVLLDGVNNAQNVGGIIRTCAFYGVTGIITENVDSLNSSASARVAEGGLEFVRALETKNKQIALVQLRQAGYQIVHLTRHKQAPSLTKTKLAEKVVFILSEIPASDIAYTEDTTIQLSFSNPLNSGLNVAVNTGILLNQWYQTHIL
ncbi:MULTISPECIES: TrmH family RNA methyltransferase [unclassified Mannheimia]|uniref:TrmH family RNA methyltransferase n=1 Tax=unclassified Mannheimia TaxID=2645054 RepID=UPI00359DE49E